MAVSVVAVVLADGNGVASGISLENGVDATGHDFENLRIGEAPLAVIAGTSFAADERVILRMRLAIHIRRQESVERMHPHIVGEQLAVILQPHPVAVSAVVVGIAEGLAETERRAFRHVHLRNADVRRRSKRIEVLGKIVHAHTFLQQSRHAVYGALAACRLYGEGATRTVNDVSVVRSLRCLSAYHHVVLGAFGCSCDIKFGTRRLAYETLQHLRRLAVHVVILCKDNASLRFALAYKAHLCRCRRRCHKASEEQQSVENLCHCNGMIIF